MTVCKTCKYTLTNENTSAISKDDGYCQSCHTDLVNQHGWQSVQEGLTGMKPDSPSAFSLKPKLNDKDLSKVCIVNVKDAGSCTYCNQSKLINNGSDIQFPYDKVIEISGQHSSARLCPDCIHKITKSRYFV